MPTVEIEKTLLAHGCHFSRCCCSLERQVSCSHYNPSQTPVFTRPKHAHNRAMALSNVTSAVIADEVLAIMADPREVAPFTERFPGYGLEDAYVVVNEIRRRREARGDRVVGRKIGFTNAAAWGGYGISGPIWNYLYEATTLDLPLPSGIFSLGHWPNVRMETEVALGLGRAPEPDMTEHHLLACIDWAALDFEICTSVFPGWRFKVADAATTGVHVGLVVGARHSIAHARNDWAAELASFSAVLSEAAGTQASGGGGQVLGSPINALRYLIKEFARYGGGPLCAGEFVTTGTPTEALPASSGQVWKASTRGIHFGEIEVRVA
jgi:2-keto-4-pentenoate hydratase